MKTLPDEKVLWENPAYTFRENYTLPASAASYVDRENEAIDRVAERFAASLVSSVPVANALAGATSVSTASVPSPGCSATSTSPSLGGKCGGRPAIRRNSEVLPAPLAPSTASACPARAPRPHACCA